jgi:cyclohexanone monooxygenase
MSGKNGSTKIGENEQVTESGVDVAGLRARYAAERDRRLRAAGNDQFIPVTGTFGDFVSDPLADPNYSRPAVVEEADVVIIGGGFGGLLAGAELRKAGLERIRIIDKAGDFGGVWYWNRYPGAMCDVESYIYMPLLEEVGYIPTEKYAHQPEIQKYCRLIGEKFDLYADALFQTEVSEARWDDASQKWVIKTDLDDVITAKYVVMTFGTQHRPRLPGIPGIKKFKGHKFHTSRWDFAYTGGDDKGNLTGLADKRVGLIGTGASAVQAVPALGASSKHLAVFQRTPSTIAVRGNRPTEPGFAETLRPGWQKRRMINFMSIALGKKIDEDLVNDSWTYALKKIGSGPLGGEEEGDNKPSEEEVERRDMELVAEIRARVDSLVEDPETAESLKPYYQFWCKRPGFHDEYLQTFNRPNVTLVDTQGRGVDEFTETGAIVDGKLYEFDCLIFATGFDVGHGYLNSGGGFDVYGRDGLPLSEYWKDGTRSYHGFHAAGFPNCFFGGSTQAGFSANFVFTLWEQAVHIGYMVHELEARSATTVEATTEAEDEWQEVIYGGASPKAAAFWASCTPGYFNSEGAGTSNKQGLLVGRYPHGALEYFEVLSNWREEGSFRGLVVK